MTHTPTLRPILLAASRSTRIERGIGKVEATRRVVDRFVAGVTEDAVVAASSQVLRSGRYVTVDYLGEDTTDRASADATVAHYEELLQALPRATGAAVRPVEVSLKLSALGQAVPVDGHLIALANARRICRAADAAGAWVTIDAEDHTTTDSTLAIVRELRKDFPTLGTVLQAYLHRTADDCREFAGPGSRIRLCKGAYREPATVAHQGKRNVDAAYVRCLKILMAGQGYPMVATHDPAMLDAALLLARIAGRGADDFEVQMLFGIRDVEQRRLAGLGYHLRVYLPYGEQWYGYFMRRLAERPANLTFFVRSLISRT